jgi:hypothetical protein
MFSGSPVSLRLIPFRCIDWASGLQAPAIAARVVARTSAGRFKKIRPEKLRSATGLHRAWIGSAGNPDATDFSRHCNSMTHRQSATTCLLRSYAGMVCVYQFPYSDAANAPCQFLAATRWEICPRVVAGPVAMTFPRCLIQLGRCHAPQVRYSFGRPAAALA